MEEEGNNDIDINKDRIGIFLVEDRVSGRPPRTDDYLVWRGGGP